MTDPLLVHDQLALGRRKLKAIFDSSLPRTLNAAELFGVAGASGGIHGLKAGWACQFHDLANGRRTILDVYLPGDVIGLNECVHARPLEEVLTLTAAVIETIPAQDALVALMADPSIALYISFLLGLRQRRADRILAAISGLDGRGRLAMKLLDFYTRLRRRKLTFGSSYNLPLSQVQIGNYLGLTVVHINRVPRSLSGKLRVHTTATRKRPSPSEPIMRQGRTIQGTIFEVFAQHESGCELKAMSQWLDGQRQLTSLVAGDRRRQGVRETGRRGLPAEKRAALRSAQATAPAQLRGVRECLNKGWARV